MKRVLGIFRGFPGLGRVVAGVSLLETLRDQYGYEVKMISYLQGDKYLQSYGYKSSYSLTTMDYCSIGLLPTSSIGAKIHDLIKSFKPYIVVIDGEPLILYSLKISFPNIKIVSLLNPSDVDNPANDKEAMDFFNSIYSLSDLAIVHGLKKVDKTAEYKNLISINTILRNEILALNNQPTNNIYCILGGGTVNVGSQFEISTIKIGRICIEVARMLPNYTFHIVCSSSNIFESLNSREITNNVKIYEEPLKPSMYYRDAGVIITRSGRNTLSELLYLEIPSIVFVTGDQYRTEEQKENIRNIKSKAIIPSSLDIEIQELKMIIIESFKSERKIKSFHPGNQMAVEHIISLM